LFTFIFIFKFSSDDQKRFDVYIRTKTIAPSKAFFTDLQNEDKNEEDLEKGKSDNSVKSLIHSETNNLNAEANDKKEIDISPSRDKYLQKYNRLETTPAYFRRTSTDILEPKLMPMPTGDLSPLTKPLPQIEESNTPSKKILNNFSDLKKKVLI